jgi:hypothetical protein
MQPSNFEMASNSTFISVQIPEKRNRTISSHCKHIRDQTVGDLVDAFPIPVTRLVLIRWSIATSAVRSEQTLVQLELIHWNMYTQILFHVSVLPALYQLHAGSFDGVRIR